MKKYIAAFAVQLLLLLAVGFFLNGLPGTAEKYGRSYTAKMTDCYAYAEWVTADGTGTYVQFTGECPSVGLFNTLLSEDENGSLALYRSYERQTMQLYCEKVLTDPDTAKNAYTLLGDDYDTTESESFCLKHDVEVHFRAFGKTVSAMQITVDGIPVEQFFASQSP